MIKTIMRLFFRFGSFGLAILFVIGLSAPTAKATTIGFDLNITMTETNANVGTGVTAGNIFTGIMFFDSTDLMPDGSRSRSILPGGDTITIAGITFDTTLNNTFYVFRFTGGAPVCIGDITFDGCGDGDGQSIPKPDGDDLIFYDDNFGRVRDSITGDAMGPYEYASFSYSFSPTIPEPATMLLLGSGLLGLGLFRKKFKK